MNSINITGSNRFSNRRSHALRWSVELPRMSANQGGDYLMEVHSITVENVFPVVVAGYNDTLYYTRNGVNGFVKVSEGNYTIFDLVASVQTGLQLVNPLYTVTYDNLQFKALLFVPPGETITFKRQDFDILEQNDYTYSSGDDRFLELLGWNFIGTSFTFVGGVAGYTWIPANIVRCVGPAYMDMCCSLPIRGSFSQTKGKFNVISRVYLSDTSFGDRHTSINQVPEKYGVNLSGHPDFEIFFLDDHGVIMSPSTTFANNIFIAYRMSFIPASSD